VHETAHKHKQAFCAGQCMLGQMAPVVKDGDGLDGHKTTMTTGFVQDSCFTQRERLID